MKGTLVFNLPEEQEEFRDAQNGAALKGDIQEFDNFLRSLLKYETLSEEVHLKVQEIRDKLHEQVPTIWE